MKPTTMEAIRFDVRLGFKSPNPKSLAPSLIFCNVSTSPLVGGDATL